MISGEEGRKHWKRFSRNARVSEDDTIRGSSARPRRVDNVSEGPLRSAGFNCPGYQRILATTHAHVVALSLVMNLG